MTDPGLPLTTGEGNTADAAYAWECAENMKGWALRAEESNRELRAERERLRERLEQAEVDTERKVDAALRSRLAESEAECGRLREQLDAARQALGQIASRGCERVTGAEGCAVEPSWRFDAPYSADQICNPCHARAALGVEGPAG